MSTIHIVGWPRWMRDRVTSHPVCEDLGIEQTVLRADAIPSDCTVVMMEDRASESEFRKTLTTLEDDIACLVLSEGVDADGAVHADEVVMFLRLGTPPSDVTSHPLLYHFQRWRQAKSSPYITSPASSEPAWLTNAGGAVTHAVDESVHTPSPTPSESVDGEVPLHTPHTTFILTKGTDEEECVLILEGVLPPNVLLSLAQPNLAVYLPTEDGGAHVLLTRVRNAIWIGRYVVDVSTWIPEARAYHAILREHQSQIAPRRTVVEMHRLRRRQFERR